MTRKPPVPTDTEIVVWEDGFWCYDYEFNDNIGRPGEKYTYNVYPVSLNPVDFPSQVVYEAWKEATA